MINCVEGTLKRVVAIRLSPQEDVLKSLISVCEKKGIKNGVIISAIGSLDGAKFYDPVVLPEKKAGYGYSDVIELKGPIELLSLNGIICNRNDKILPHLHFSLSDENGKAYGGHVIEGNKVLLTVDMVIGELEGIHMGREYDPELELEIFKPEKSL